MRKRREIRYAGWRAQSNMASYYRHFIMALSTNAWRTAAILELAVLFPGTDHTPQSHSLSHTPKIINAAN